MNRRDSLLLIGAALLAYILYTHTEHSTPAPTTPAPPAKPKVDPAPKKPAPGPHCPRCPQRAAEQSPAPASKAPQLGGTVSPDGTTEILPLPSDIKWPKNIPSRGLGCCTFRSLDYAARWQNEPALVDLPEKMVEAGIAGGGYPQKLDSVIRRFDAECRYFNDTSKSWEILAACIASQRIACVDYSGRDPHYHGSIAHCVCVAGFSAADDWVAILDNNYPSLDEIVWMGRAEFSSRWNGWCYGILNITPGHCAGSYTESASSFGAGNDGIVNFGLETASFPMAGSSVLNGEASSTAAILDAIGPAMAPIRVNVDHSVEPLTISADAEMMVLFAGGVVCLYLISRKES